MGRYNRKATLRDRQIDISLAVKKQNGDERLRLAISNLRRGDFREVDYKNKSAEWVTINTDHAVKIRQSRKTWKYLLIMFNRWSVGPLDEEDVRALLGEKYCRKRLHAFTESRKVLEFSKDERGFDIDKVKRVA